MISLWAPHSEFTLQVNSHTHTHTLSMLCVSQAISCFQFSFSSSSSSTAERSLLGYAFVKLSSWTFNPSLPLVCRCFCGNLKHYSIRFAASLDDDDDNNDNDAPSSSSCFDIKTSFKFCGCTTLNWNIFSLSSTASGFLCALFRKRKSKAYDVCMIRQF